MLSQSAQFEIVTERCIFQVDVGHFGHRHIQETFTKKVARTIQHSLWLCSLAQVTSFFPGWTGFPCWKSLADLAGDISLAHAGLPV